MSVDYSKDTGDRLLEHYARLKAEKSHLNIEACRASIDNAGERFYGLLGRMTEADVANGYDGRYVYLRALVNAGIADDDEQAEWEKLIAEAEKPTTLTGDQIAQSSQAERDADHVLPAPVEYDNDLPPAAWDREEPAEPEHLQLLEDLHELQTLKATIADLNDKVKAVQERALERQRAFGRPIALFNPVTRTPEIAGVRQSETLVVDAGELLKALVEYYGDDEQAEAIWAGVLKPREVDTKKDGLFHQAVLAHSDDVNGIPREVVAKVASFKPSAPYIGFSKPESRGR